MKTFTLAAVAALAIGAMAIVAPANATTYHAVIDTSAFAGTSAQFAWDLIGNGAAFSDGSHANTVTITGFATDGSWSPATNTGSVTGNLPGNVALTDAVNFFNEDLIDITLGNFIAFDFTATNNFPGLNPTGFSAYLFDPTTFASIFPTTEPGGTDALFLLSIYGLTQDGKLDVFSVPGGDASVRVADAAAPEAATWIMMIGGLAMLGFAARSRKNAGYAAA
jgi:hypothetical protein